MAWSDERMPVRGRDPKTHPVPVGAVHGGELDGVLERLAHGHPGRVPAEVLYEFVAHVVEDMRRPTEQGDE